MSQGTDLSHLYSLRTDFTVIALTGRTGSGCTTVAENLVKKFEDVQYPKPNSEGFDLHNNSYKKYQIVYKYAQANPSLFEMICYRDIITLFLLEKDIQNLVVFLQSSQVIEAFSRLKKKVEQNYSVDSEKGLKEALEKVNVNFSIEIEGLKTISDEFEVSKKLYEQIDHDQIRSKNHEQSKQFKDFLFSTSFKSLSSKIHSALKTISPAKHNIILQLITNNIRRSGDPYKSKDTDATNIFKIAEKINIAIKAIRNVSVDGKTKIVIDSLRNPFEVMFFKQRYSAFYLVAINRESKMAEIKLKEVYNEHYLIVKQLLEEEYSGGKGKEFYKQFVRSCIEKADIHITYRDEDDTKELNAVKLDKTTPYFSWKMQILKYLALIEQPGIVTPSPEERCMQLAYTAKYNSGCISRQVGAAITDENYSIKAIGWNNTPEGQTPCLLRNVEKLVNSTDEELKQELKLDDEVTKKLKQNNLNLRPNSDLLKEVDPDLYSFTPFEKSDVKFLKAVNENYKTQIEDNGALLKGRNVCMCFKSLHNSCYDGKNQVHTRSLHAEESAFLQITKYGGVAIKNGKLFTTASPCELCAKKAYQLGIRVIYYVDPYPGISQPQILDTGKNPPEVRLFNGAIGNAYHWLYEPFMAYKDELALILGHTIKDKLTQIQEESERIQEESESKENIYKQEIDKLKKELSDLKSNDNN